MRRALASILLGLLSFPLIAPVLRANTVSDLPACCRRDGKHHCAMSESAAGEGLKAAQTQCPLFPKTAAIVQSSSKIILLGAAPRMGALPPSCSTTLTADQDRPRLAAHYAIQKRGPPAGLHQTHQISL
jgi:hypothetical protein